MHSNTWQRLMQKTTGRCEAKLIYVIPCVLQCKYTAIKIFSKYDEILKFLKTEKKPPPPNNEKP